MVTYFGIQFVVSTIWLLTVGRENIADGCRYWTVLGGALLVGLAWPLIVVSLVIGALASPWRGREW